MNEVQSAALLTYVIGFDPTWSTTDRDLAGQRVRGWAHLLTDVPLDFARAMVDRWYRDPDAGRVTPGWILNRWGDHLRHQGPQEPTPLGGVIDQLFHTAPDWVRPYFEACRDAADEMRARGVEYGSPEWKAGLPEPPVATELDQTDPERKCGEPRCGCPHTHCRAGWLDGPSNWERAERCPLCWEATDMRETLAADERPRRRWGAR